MFRMKIFYEFGHLMMMMIHCNLLTKHITKYIVSLRECFYEEKFKNELNGHIIIILNYA